MNAYERATAEFEGECCAGHPKAVAAREAKAALEVGVSDRSRQPEPIPEVARLARANH